MQLILLGQGKKAPTTGTPAGEDAPTSTPAVASAAKKPSPAAVAAAAAATSKPSKGGAGPAPGALDSFKFRHTPEDADALAADMIPENFAAGLSDSNWKTRLATLEEMHGWLDGSVADLDSEVVVRFLAKKGWSEKNFQVSIDASFPALAQR